MAAKQTPKKADEWRPIFLEALRNSANVRAACKAAGIIRASAYAARDKSPEFRAAWDVALEEACDVLEAVARKRATESSDTLLIFLLKAHRPGVYRETVNVQLTLRREAERLAAEYGLDADALIREAEQIVSRR